MLSSQSLNLRFPIGTINDAPTCSDARTHGYQGPSRTVRLPRVTTSRGGAISKSEDDSTCVVVGKDSLRVVRVGEATERKRPSPETKTAVNHGGHYVESSRNYWPASGLKADSASADVVWGRGAFSNKIITGASNGSFITWDIQRSGSIKIDRRTLDHSRSINKLAYSMVHSNYCASGSSDGDVRIWDLRDTTRSKMRIHFATSVRSLIFSPGPYDGLHLMVALDNGSIFRWDVGMAQRGQVDRLVVAHGGPVLGLDWVCPSPTNAASQSGPETKSMSRTSSAARDSRGWVVSGGLDSCVKVWDLHTSPSRIQPKPTYTMHTSFPVRRVLWRPSYECEIAVVSNGEFAFGSNPDLTASAKSKSFANLSVGVDVAPTVPPKPVKEADGGNAVEIWDVRRGWLAKWSIDDSNVEGGVTDIAFRDSHAMWSQHPSGTFSQLDLRSASKPMDSIPRGAATWDVSGSLFFVTDHKQDWEIPYDDLHPNEHISESSKRKKKSLGDKPPSASSQTMGVYVSEEPALDQEMFAKLARSYVVESTDRADVCRHNAEAAMQAGHQQATQTWLLAASLLEDVTSASSDELQPTTPPPHPPLLPHAKTAPATVIRSPSKSIPSKIRSSSSEAIVLHAEKDRNVGLGLGPEGRTAPSPTPKRTNTPTSSNSSSPQIPQKSSPAPVRPAATRLRRDTDIGAHSSRPRRPSIRHMSMSNPSINRHHALSNDYLRHVGDGALDSDSGSDDDQEHERDSPLMLKSRATLPLPEPPSSRSSPSPPPPKTSRRGSSTGPSMLVNPSPLSQKHWDTEDDEEASVSPGSGDTDHETDQRSSALVSRRPSGKRRTPARHGRKRSSTISSTVSIATAIAAPTLHRPLEKQESYSSIRTVTADGAGHAKPDGDKLTPEDPLVVSTTIQRPSLNHHSRTISSLSVPSDHLLRRSDDDRRTPTRDPSPQLPKRRLSRSEKTRIAEEEAELRRLGWKAVREAFDFFANEGDVQICATLCCVVAEELEIGRSRCERVIESYLDLLARFRLHTVAAYMRKFAGIEAVAISTGVQTTYYSTCGRCKKPILIPAFGIRPEGTPLGDFAYCLDCKSFSARCSVCRLPVRALLIQCPTCGHGGHQDCYRRYYLEHPLAELPPSTLPAALPEVRGRSGLTAHGLSAADSADALAMAASGPSPASTTADERPGALSATEDVTSPSSTLPVPASVHVHSRPMILGHPCAAGCGHFCWAANEGVELVPS